MAEKRPISAFARKPTANVIPSPTAIKHSSLPIDPSKLSVPDDSSSTDTLNRTSSTDPSQRSSLSEATLNARSALLLSPSSTLPITRRESQISNSGGSEAMLKSSSMDTGLHLLSDDPVSLSRSTTLRYSASNASTEAHQQGVKKLIELPEGWENEEFEPKYDMWRKALLEALLSDAVDDEEYPLLIPPDLALLISEEEF